MFFLSLVVYLFLQIIRAAAEGNREGVLKRSIDMKFLTGYESKVTMPPFALYMFDRDTLFLQFH